MTDEHRRKLAQGRYKRLAKRWHIYRLLLTTAQMAYVRRKSKQNKVSVAATIRGVIDHFIKRDARKEA